MSFKAFHAFTPVKRKRTRKELMSLRSMRNWWTFRTENEYTFFFYLKRWRRSPMISFYFGATCPLLCCFELHVYHIYQWKSSTTAKKKKYFILTEGSTNEASPSICIEYNKCFERNLPRKYLFGPNVWKQIRCHTIFCIHITWSRCVIFYYPSSVASYWKIVSTLKSKSFFFSLSCFVRFQFSPFAWSRHKYVLHSFIP